MEKNVGLKVCLSQGINNNKYFQDPRQVAQDSENDQIVRRGQFAFNKATTRNGDKISIAYRDGDDCTVSSAYQVFYIEDEEQLNPHYLMMWFKRPEFDRYARFKSHGSAHEFFTFEEMCNVLLPVPPIEEQRRIVAEYQTVERRIKNNEVMIQKLEETAQAIYHHTFVEGIDENNLPEGWRMGCLGDITICFDKMRKPVAGYERTGKAALYPYYGATSIMDYVDEYIFDGEYILLGEDGSVIDDTGKPYLQYVRGKCWINNHAHVLQGKGAFNNNILYIMLKNTTIANYVTGAVQLKLNQQNMNSIPVLIADDETLYKLQSCLNPIMDYIYCIEKELTHLHTLQSLLTSRLA